MQRSGNVVHIVRGRPSICVTGADDKCVYAEQNQKNGRKKHVVIRQSMRHSEMRKKKKKYG